jgi:hypothetical protein
MAAMLIAVMALLAALGGAAYAGTKIGSNGLKNNAVTTKKIKSNAVTTKKIKNGAVTTTKLDPSERSEGFVTSPAQVSLPGGSDTIVATLNLPVGGKYILNASVDLGNNAASQNLVNCQLEEGALTLASGDANLAPLAVFSQTIALTGAAINGGSMVLACTPDNGAQARNPVITATRVANLKSQ